MEKQLTIKEQAALDAVKPICAECAHSFVDDVFSEYKCSLTERCIADNVSGRVRTYYTACERYRSMSDVDNCGPKGKYYEPRPVQPKKSWLERLIAWVN